MTLRRRHFVQAAALSGLTGATFRTASAARLTIPAPAFAVEAELEINLRVSGWDGAFDGAAGPDAWVGIDRNWRAAWR